MRSRIKPALGRLLSHDRAREIAQHPEQRCSLEAEGNAQGCHLSADVTVGWDDELRQERRLEETDTPRRQLWLNCNAYVARQHAFAAIIERMPYRFEQKLTRATRTTVGQK